MLILILEKQEQNLEIHILQQVRILHRVTQDQQEGLVVHTAHLLIRHRPTPIAVLMLLQLIQLHHIQHQHITQAERFIQDQEVVLITLIVMVIKPM